MSREEQTEGTVHLRKSRVKDQPVNSGVLITGATGFIGLHLVKSLVEKKNDVKCLVRRSASKEALDYLGGQGAEVVYGDLLDRESLAEAVDGVETVFHLGGGGRVGMPEDVCRKINVDGTRNILDACLKRGGVKKFIHVSTCVVMGDIKGDKPVDENYPCNPADMAYSKMKTEAEKIALSYKDRIPLVVVRLPGVYGPPRVKSESDNIGGVTPALMVISSIKNGQWRYVGDGKNMVHLFYIDDAVHGLELAAKYGRIGEVYIVGDKRSIMMEEMVETAARILNVDAPTGHIPARVAYFFAALFELKSKLFGGAPRMSREMVTGFTVNMNFDTSKARRELGYEPTVGLEEGMRRTYEWYKEQGYIE